MSLEFGTIGVDWQEGINFPRLRKQRLSKAQAAMKKHGIAACVLTRQENIRYTTSTAAPMILPQVRYALVFAEHEPIIYELGESLPFNKANCPWIKPENWRCSYSWFYGYAGPEATRAGAKNWANAILQDLKEKGLDKEKLGIDAVDEASMQALTEVGIETVDIKPAIMEARCTKTKDEVNCMRMAIAIAGAAIASVMQTIQPGTIGLIRECDVAAEATRAILKAGADIWSPVTGIISGQKTFDVCHIESTSRIIEVGDILYVRACMASFSMYSTCYYRSFIVGRKPNQKERDFYKRLYDRVYSVIGAIKPGATTADAAKHFLPASTWGYDKEECLTFRAVGHGIGLTNQEAPIISRIHSFNYPQLFETGMVIAVEDGEGELGYGGFRLEEMVLVTDKGTEVLTPWPAEEVIPLAVL